MPCRLPDFVVFARDSDFYVNLLGCQGRVKQSPVKTNVGKY